MSDNYNHRILIFDTIPTTHNATADIIIGQTNFTNNTYGTSEVRLRNPHGICYGNEKLFVADYGNNRVLMYKDSFLSDVKLVDPNHGIYGESVNVAFVGMGFGTVTSIRLVNSTQSVNATNLNIISDNKMTCTFNLNAESGIYDIEINNSGDIYTFTKMFFLLEKSTGETSWITAAIGSASAPSIAGTYYGLAIGDCDNDEKQEVVVANRNTQLLAFDFFSTYWDKTLIPGSTTGKYLSSAIICDADNDGQYDIYSGALNSGYSISQFVSPGWNESVVGNGADKFYDLAYGDINNDGKLEIYAGGEDGSVYQFNYSSGWSNSIIATGNSRILSLAVGDGASTGDYVLYSSNADFHIYQYKFNGTSWSKTDVGAGEGEMTAVSVGDGNNDNQMEIYGANKDGKVYQYKWMISSWEKNEVGNTGKVLNDVQVNDADNDGLDEVYVSTNNGKLIQYKYQSNQWTGLEIGSINGSLYSLAIGGGDNNNSFEIYGVGEDNNVYQFAAKPAILTPTPTVTPETLDGFDGKLISKKYTYTAPNPVRGNSANFTIHVREYMELEVKVYTAATNKFVMSFNMTCSGPGKYQKQVYMGNLANGVYMFLVKADNKQGVRDRLIKKIALIK